MYHFWILKVLKKDPLIWLGMVEHTCNPSKLQVELRESEVQSHPQVSSEFRVSLGSMKTEKKGRVDLTQFGILPIASFNVEC